MRKILTTTLLATSISLGLGMPATQVFASPENAPQLSQKNAEKGLQDALKTQVALAKAKVSLLEARTEFWLEKKSDKALKSLDKARANLDEGWQSANDVTRARITQLKLQVEKASKLLKEKSQDAEAELLIIADRSEASLNSALTQVQTKTTDLKGEMATRYALVQANASTLKARIALEVEQSPEKAKQALQETRDYLQQAKAGVSKVSAEKLSQLQAKTEEAQKAVSEKASDAKARVSDLVVSTEEHIQTYGKAIQESEEAMLLKKRYGQLEAKVALMKAKLAEEGNATEEQVTAYLDESKAWYNSLNSKTKEGWNKEIANITARINEAKQAVKSKDKQARSKLADLLEQAAMMIKGEEPVQ